MFDKQPKKYTKVNGVMKLNPAFKKWKEKQNTKSAEPGMPPVAVTTLLEPKEALAVVSSIEDHEKLNANTKMAIPLAESTTATIEMLQDDDICESAGMNVDEMVDQLGEMLEKYEIPIGLTNKLMMISEYESLEFIVDDSGSMRLDTDTIDKVTGNPISRWKEAQNRLKEMIEIIAYVPFEQIGIEFLNRKDRLSIKRDGMNDTSPKGVIQSAYAQIDAIFAIGPKGKTPALEKLQESFARGNGVSISRYFFGDGKPNGGKGAIAQIIQLLKTRPEPDQNPVTFLSCTDDDDAVEWMKDCEEVAPYCSESDDFNDEAREVLLDQGAALPYSKGFHLICQIVAAMNPDDLDAMDESTPFTKFTLDNLLGYVSNEESYKHYFTKFQEAQKKRTVSIDERTGQQKKTDLLKKNTQWNINEFRSTQGPAKLIQEVQSFKQAMYEQHMQ